MSSYSVVITHFNKEKELEELLISLSRQSLKPQEVIVIDDCSNNTLIIPPIDELSDLNIKVFVNDASRGANYSRNFGISEASNDYVALSDDDDLWLPQKAEKQLEVMKQGMSLSLCNYDRFDSFGKYHREDSPESGIVLLNDMVKGNGFCGTSGVFLNKRLVKCKFDETLCSSQDWDYYLQVILAGNKVHFNNEVLFNYRVNQLFSITSKKLSHANFCSKFDATIKYRGHMKRDVFCQRAIRLWFNNLKRTDNKFLATKFLIDLLGPINFCRFLCHHVLRLFK